MQIIEGKNIWTRILKAGLLSLLAFFAGPVLIFLGARRLKHLPHDSPNYAPLKLLLWVGAIFYLILFGVVIWVMMIRPMTRPPETGLHCDAVPWLMPQASDISYKFAYAFGAYDFKISEEDFRKCSRAELKEIETPVKVPRHDFDPENRDATTHTATSGLQAIYEENSRTVLVYDRDLGRAFFFSTRPQY